MYKLALAKAYGSFARNKAAQKTIGKVSMPVLAGRICGFGGGFTRFGNMADKGDCVSRPRKLGGADG